MHNSQEHGRLRVFVTVGTDHHPFDRLVAWIEGWLVSRDIDNEDCLIQSGTSRSPTRGGSRPYLTFEEVKRAISSADAIVTHGGPGSIMLSASFGKVPIVVPRLSRFGEHVDDHQVVFARRLAEYGDVLLAEDVATLHRTLDSDPNEHATEVKTSVHVAETVGLFGRLVDGLLLSQKPRRGGEWK